MSNTDTRTRVTESLAKQADGRTDRPGVYALLIDTPDAGFETHARRWLAAGYETTPPYLPAIVDAERVVYVGAAKSVRDRLEDHLAGDVRKATLPTVYDITDLDGVWWYDDADAAFGAEQSIRDDIAREHPGWYVHAR
jgi:predicted GIY-YIG superfamily endonuclease